jgi:hypothetical protein
VKLTEKEILLLMIDNYKKYNSYCYIRMEELHCKICFYHNHIGDKCNYILTYNKSQMPEELYIKKFGYESLVEELI